MSNPPPPDSSDSDPVAKPAAEEPRAQPTTIHSRDLFKGTREVLIDHSGEIYRLRLTRNGKLILHK
jgi:hemin uptake protein HemP